MTFIILSKKVGLVSLGLPIVYWIACFLLVEQKEIYENLDKKIVEVQAQLTSIDSFLDSFN